MPRTSVVRWVLDDRYAVLRALGSGGFGEVFLARDEVLGREVALKVLSRRSDDGGVIERFKREARSAASLSHPNVVAVHDFGQDPEGGAPYIVMEYVPGSTLADILKGEGALSPGTAAAVALGVARGLEAAHRRGVIHRDVKPANVLLTVASATDTGTAGAVKVADFGVARVVADGTLTEENALVGTAHYLSPEQAMGRSAGPASDLYSLWVVLYEMLAGRRPFEAEGAESPLAVAMRHVTEEPEPPSASNPEVPLALDTLVMRLLAKDPERRPASAAVLAEELERIAESSVGGGPDSTPAGIGVDDRTVRAEETGTESVTLRIPPPSEAPRGERAERGYRRGGVTRAVRRRGRRGRGRLGLAAPAAALLFVVFLAVSAVAFGGERLQGVAGWAPIVPPGSDAQDAGSDARAGRAAGRPATAEAATGGSVDGGPPGVEGAGAMRAAVEYYKAVDQESWAYTYGELDSQSREMFTEPEWYQRNQWFADNENLELASMEVDVTGLSASGSQAEANVRRTFENGVVIDRDTVFVFEEGSWKHRLVGRELFLFMPGATYEEFVEAR